MPGETVLYQKIGRRYHPISMERCFDAWPEGFHLVYCRPSGGTLTHFRIQPGRAELIAALLEHEDRLVDLLREKVAPRIHGVQKLTKRQHEAFEQLKAAMGTEWVMFEREDAVGVLRTLIDWLRDGCISDQ